MMRGTSARIDPNKYRILTAEMGLPNKPRDLCGGSIVRVVWQVAGEASENYSWGIPVNSRAGANVVNRINLDVAALPIDPASPSHSGWTPGLSAFPGIAGFRIDPHEFANPTGFFIKRIKLAALEKAASSYTVRWTVEQGRRHRAGLLRHRSRPDQQDADRIDHGHVDDRQSVVEHWCRCHKGRSTSSTSSSTMA